MKHITLNKGKKERNREREMEKDKIEREKYWNNIIVILPRV